MKNGRLVASVGAAVVAVASALFAGGAAASAATTAASPASSGVYFDSVDGCTIEYDLQELRNTFGAYVEVGIISNPCDLGVEAGIKGPNGTPIEWGNDVKANGSVSTAGHIPANSGNHHGIRVWAEGQWNPHWND